MQWVTFTAWVVLNRMWGRCWLDSQLNTVVKLVTMTKLTTTRRSRRWLDSEREREREAWHPACTSSLSRRLGRLMHQQRTTGPLTASRPTRTVAGVHAAADILRRNGSLAQRMSWNLMPLAKWTESPRSTAAPAIDSYMALQRRPLPNAS